MNLEQVFKDKEVLNGKVTAIKYIKQLDKECLVIMCKNRKVIMPCDQIDVEREWINLDGFLGRVLYFVPIEIDGHMLVVSRKKLQEDKRDIVLRELHEGKEFDAVVINTLKYAAYVEVEGVLTGLLKNKDFSDELISVKEAVRKGGKVKVRMKPGSTDDKLLLVAAEKYVSNKSAFFDIYKVDDEIPGIVKTLRADKCFINLIPGIDGLANVPNFEIDEDVAVNFRITKIDKEAQRVRGKVISIKGN